MLRNGCYLHPNGRRVSLRDDFVSAQARSQLYVPNQFKSVARHRDQVLEAHGQRPLTQFEVQCETTLHAARRFLATEPAARVMALNFASARHPGGGFLNGSQAQEESLARASGLYPCIAQFHEMYDANSRSRSSPTPIT